MINTSGILPKGTSILVYPDPIEEKTKGGIYVGTPEQIERLYLAQTEGVVVAVGENAWYDEKEPRAKVGDRVIFAKYAGMLCPSKKEDDKMYRLIEDRDVRAILEGENK